MHHLTSKACIIFPHIFCGIIFWRILDPYSGGRIPVFTSKIAGWESVYLENPQSTILVRMISVLKTDRIGNSRPGQKISPEPYFWWCLIVWNSRPNLKSRPQSEISAKNWKSRIFQFRVKFQTIGVRRYTLPQTNLAPQSDKRIIFPKLSGS